MNRLTKVAIAVAALLVARALLGWLLQPTDLMDALARANGGHFARAAGAFLYLWIHGLVVLLVPPLVCAEALTALTDRAIRAR